MKTKLTHLALGLWLGVATATAADPLPSWNDTAPRKAIVAFVEQVTKEGSPDFVPAPERLPARNEMNRIQQEQTEGTEQEDFSVASVTSCSIE